MCSGMLIDVSCLKIARNTRSRIFTEDMRKYSLLKRKFPENSYWVAPSGVACFQISFQVSVCIKMCQMKREICRYLCIENESIGKKGKWHTRRILWTESAELLGADCSNREMSAKCVKRNSPGGFSCASSPICTLWGEHKYSRTWYASFCSEWLALEEAAVSVDPTTFM